MFDYFAKASGHRISMEKTKIFLAGVTEEVHLEITSRFRFTSGELPVRYLGLPLDTKCMGVNDYQPLMESI